jgi:RNA polymerase sigma-70 factor (ECF subfamily)
MRDTSWTAAVTPDRFAMTGTPAPNIPTTTATPIAGPPLAESTGDERRSLDALRRGDRDAFAALYAAHKAAVLALAAAMLGHEGRDGAWDVLHDVFVNLARAAPTLPDGCNVRAYVLRSAANGARDWIARRKTREAHRERASTAPATLPPPVEPFPDPALAASDREQVLRLWAALARLPDEQRTVLASRVYGQLSFAEIAEAEGIPENTAHSRFRYAIQKLRREMNAGATEGSEPS